MTGAGRDGPLAGPALALVAVALALGTFMQVLDSTIANVSLTTIAGNLGVSADTSTWVITAFAVANGITVPLTGWLMRRFGVVRTFVFSVLLFTVSSFLCGIAWNLPSLILFRLLQGGVSGPMIPGSQALLLAVFPPHKRALALGVWSMTTLVGPVAGPILGGYISDNFHWGWIFLINVPVGLFSALVAWRFLRHNDTPTPRLGVDVIGIAMLAVWVGALQVVLDLGKNADWFNSQGIVVLTALAAVGFAAWLIWELTERSPAVDLSLFRYRNFALGVVAQSLGYAIFFANNLLMPLWLQRQMGYTATWAGLVSAPSGVVAVLLTPILTRVSHKFDTRLLASLSFIAFGLSYALRSHFTPETDFWHFMLPMLVQGVAMSVFFMAMLTIQLDGIPAERLPAATGISSFVRITAGSFAASVITTLWDRREALHQSRLAEGASASHAAYAAATAHLESLGQGARAAAGAINGTIVDQAYLMAATDLFWLSSLGSFAMIALVWLARRPAAPSGPVAAD
jgi:DHA2 family multidrug resistance protein